MTCSIFRIDDGERHWYAADSAEDALQMHSNLIGESVEFLQEEGVQVLSLPDDEELTIIDDPEGDRSQRTTKTCQEWASAGRDIIGSTVY